MTEGAPVQERTWYLATVRYGKMLHTAKFRTDNPELVRVRDRCVVRTDRGREFGTLLTSLEALAPGKPAEGSGEILRKATPEDLNNEKRIEQEMRVKAMQACREEIQKLAPRLLEPLMEQGNIYEDMAKADPTKWGTAYNYWKRLAAQLEGMRPRRAEYYEAYLHMAQALRALDKKDQAAAIIENAAHPSVREELWEEAGYLGLA